MVKKWTGVLLIVLLAGIAGFNLYNDRKNVTDIDQAGAIVNNDQTGIAVDSKAPDFTLQTIEGKKVKLSDYKGKKVFLNFWATWCPPCKEEMPHMQAFYENKPDDVEILAVNIEESREKAADFADQYSLTFPVLLDKDGAVSEKYDIYTIPTTYVLDEKGIVDQKLIGPMDEELMKKLVQ